MDTALLIIGVITVILLLIITVKLFSGKKDSSSLTDEKIDNLTKLTLDGFSSVRTQHTQESENVRQSVTSSLEAVRGKMDVLSEKTADGQLNVVRSLSDMREKLDATGRQQTAAVADAIGKMQQSNEKKLEEMRLTVDEKLTSTLTTRLDSSFKSVSEQLFFI